MIGGAAAAVLLLITFVVLPGFSRMRSQSRAAAAAEGDFAEVRKARPEIERIQRETVAKAGIVRAAANVKDAPLSRITSALQEAGIPQSALNIKSGGARDGELFREEAFDVRIENLTYLEAVKTLQRLSAGTLPVDSEALLPAGTSPGPASCQPPVSSRITSPTFNSSFCFLSADSSVTRP